MTTAAPTARVSSSEPPRRRPVGSGRSPRRGFTILETVLAVVVGALVLLGCVSVFLATNRAERAFSRRFERTSELWTTQLATRRAFLNLLMAEQPDAAPDPNPDVNADVDVEPAARSRIILEPDAAAPASPTGFRPQRLEVTVARSPVPAILGSQIGSWIVQSDRADPLDLTGTGVSSGAIRGVFELRPAGARELLMTRLGLHEPDHGLEQRMATDPPPGWTLWWRPILSAEQAELETGVPPRPDTSGGADLARTRLAGAIPILTGVNTLVWTIFKSDERVTAYQGLTITDLPAFAELEVSLLNGQYASWMFEVDWTVGEDPDDIADEAEDPDANPDDDGDDDSPPPGGPPPPGGSRPPSNNGNYDIGGGRRP